MVRVLAVTALLGAIISNTALRAEIFRWDTGEVIPGTEEITPSPGFAVGDRDLEFADLQRRNLAGSFYRDTDLEWATFAGSNLAGAVFRSSDLANVDLSGSQLTGAAFTDVSLAGANFSGALVPHASLKNATSAGFGAEQLYATASYADGDLRGINLEQNNLSQWNFAGQDLSGATFRDANLTGANFTGAVLVGASLQDARLTGADFANAAVAGTYLGTTDDGFTAQQLYSTASYQARHLHGIRLAGNLSDWDFSDQDLSGAGLGGELTGANLRRANLTDASLHNATLTGADLTDAIIPGANFRTLPGRVSISADQLYSTASYKSQNLSGLRLEFNDLTGWDFSGQDLSGAHFYGATLANADYTDAIIGGASFARTTSSGFAPEQLYTTASYKSRDLHDIDLSVNELIGWNLAGQNLADATFRETNIRSSDFSEADLTGATFHDVEISDSDFRFANLSGATFPAGFRLTNVDLTGAILRGIQMSSVGTMENVRLRDADLTNSMFAAWMPGVDLQGAKLAGARIFGDLSGANLRGVDLSDAELILILPRMIGADLTDAVITGTAFRGTGVTSEQLYSTASYKAKDLTGASFEGESLPGVDLSGQKLTGGGFVSTDITDADFSSADVTFVNLAGATGHGFTREQLYSTASFQNGNLEGIWLADNDLAEWDFSNQDLSGARLQNALLAGTDFQGAEIVGVSFRNSTAGGFTAEQLYSTASYQGGSLRGVDLGQNDLSGWNFAGQDLTDGSLAGSRLTGADFTDATIRGVHFGPDPEGQLTEGQLYSTASYQSGDLQGISFASGNVNADLSGWDFGQQNLSGAAFNRAILVDAIFRGANLTNADLRRTNLTGADLTDAVVAGAKFDEAHHEDAITAEQLYSTASYAAKELPGVDLSGLDLSSWDFAGQNLAGAEFLLARLHGADFTAADLRRATNFLAGFSTVTRNAIRRDGDIRGLRLESGDMLVVRDLDLGVSVLEEMMIQNGGALELVLADATWGSTIAVDPALTPSLDGTLRIRFADMEEPSGLIGAVFDLFDWNGTLAADSRFSVVDVPRGDFGWNLGRLYTTGEVALTPAGSGDYNANGFVDQGDLDLVLLHWGTTTDEPPPSWINDVPAGLVDQAALDRVLSNWGSTLPFDLTTGSASGGAIPEPTSMLMFVVVGVVLIASAARRAHRLR